jgi:replication factor C subunit 2/4
MLLRYIILQLTLLPYILLQSALRRTMEKESKTTRFCLICNYVSRIIVPIASRCAKFRFKPLTNNILQQRLKEICEKENVACSDGAIEALLLTSEGDMRKAITTLQSVARFKSGDEVTKNDIYDIAGVCV